MEIPSEIIPYFSPIIDAEKWGHIGYHGANQGYRVYQDVIRLTVEKILEIPIRKDFQFLRVPGDADLNINSLKEFANRWQTIDNKNEKRKKQLLSLNFGIYSNFDEEGSCSLNLFVKNKSKTIIDYSSALTPFFCSLGISTDHLKDLFAIARKWLDEEYGILIQISEHSHVNDPNNEAYNFADTYCYPSRKGGYPWDSQLISKHFENIMTDRYLESQLDIAPQLRLLINNRDALNPFSDLDVRRWDLYDSETIVFYEAEMREYIKHMKYDPIKVQMYRDYLLALWLQEDAEAM